MVNCEQWIALLQNWGQLRAIVRQCIIHGMSNKNFFFFFFLPRTYIIFFLTFANKFHSSTAHDEASPCSFSFFNFPSRCIARLSHPIKYYYLTPCKCFIDFYRTCETIISSKSIWCVLYLPGAILSRNVIFRYEYMFWFSNNNCRKEVMV